MRLLMLPGLAILLLSSILAGCGGSGSDSASPTIADPETTAAGATDNNADRFVFGATAGKPVVYWVHTDW